MRTKNERETSLVKWHVVKKKDKMKPEREIVIYVGGDRK